MRTLASPWAMFTFLIVASFTMPLCTGGCATGPGGPSNPDQQLRNRVAFLLGTITINAVLLADEEDPEIVAFLKAEIQASTEELTGYLGTSSPVAGQLAAMVAGLLAGGDWNTDDWLRVKALIGDALFPPPTGATP